MDAFHIWHKWSLAWEGVLRATRFDLDLYLKVIQPWIFNKTAKIGHFLSCPLYSTHSSGWIFSIFGTNGQRYWPFVCGIHRSMMNSPHKASFDVFFDLRMNKRLSKQPWGWWFETSLHSLWCHCNAAFMLNVVLIGVALNESCTVMLK